MLMFILNLTTIFIYLNQWQDSVFYKAYIFNPCTPRPPTALGSWQQGLCLKSIPYVYNMFITTPCTGNVYNSNPKLVQSNQSPGLNLLRDLNFANLTAELENNKMMYATVSTTSLQSSNQNMFMGGLIFIVLLRFRLVRLLTLHDDLNFLPKKSRIARRLSSSVESSQAESKVSPTSIFVAPVASSSSIDCNFLDKK